MQRRLNIAKLDKDARKDAWKQFIALEEEDGLAFAKWNTYRKETLHEIDSQI